MSFCQSRQHKNADFFPQSSLRTEKVNRANIDSFKSENCFRNSLWSTSFSLSVFLSFSHSLPIFLSFFSSLFLSLSLSFECLSLCSVSWRSKVPFEMNTHGSLNPQPIPRHSPEEQNMVQGKIRQTGINIAWCPAK